MTDDSLGQNYSEVSFEFDKYNKPKQLNLRETVANTIINALFMESGNNPAMPNLEINIRQYFYSYEEDLNGDLIQQQLETACGTLPGGATIDAVDFSVQETTANDKVFLIVIKISFGVNDTKALGIMLKDEKDAVRFNFDYVDI